VQRLTGADATFLYSETANARMEVASVVIGDGRGLPRGEALLDHARAYLEPRLHLAPLLRRRLVRVPLALDHPVWIEDPDFDLEFHLRHSAIPAPGSMKQLGDVVGRIMSRPLDQNRPLWEMYVIEGLEDDRIALLCKTHHAAVDGVAGFELLTSLIDFEPDAAPPPPPDTPWEPERIPTDVDLVAGAAANLVRQPVRGLKAARRLARTTIDSRRRTGSATTALVGRGGAPPTPFNGTIGPHRRVRFLDIPLSSAKAVKDAAGVKLNDVVLATVAGGLRRYLLRHEALPIEPLVAFVPVSTRGAGGDGANETAMVHVPLHTDLTDPGVRLRSIASDAAEAKALHNELGPTFLVDISELSGPAVAAAALRLGGITRIIERTRIGGNVVVSNIPGSPVPLWTAGAEITALYPLGPLTDGMGLNVTLISYLDKLGFGFVADRELVPDLDDLVDDVGAAFGELTAVFSPPVPSARAAAARS
jgi:diacylglycerol O-acyltransferase / wax synthase